MCEILEKYKKLIDSFNHKLTLFNKINRIQACLILATSLEEINKK